MTDSRSRASHITRSTSGSRSSAARRYPTETVRAALDLDPEVDLVMCDARHRESVKNVLVAVVEHALVLADRGHEPVAT